MKRITCPFAAALVLLCGCRTIHVDQHQFFDSRRLALPDSLRATDQWPSPYQLQDGWYLADDQYRYWLWLRHPDADVTVLYFGGANFQIGEDLARLKPLTRLGVDIFVVDYPGYGASGGEPGLGAFERAALAAWDEALRRTGRTPAQLIVHGHSLGTMVAAYLAERRPVGALVLEGPATNVREWADSFRPWYARPFVRFRFEEDVLAVDNSARLRQVRAPLLILAGARDRETVPAMARRLYETSATPPDMKSLVVLDGTGHMILRDDPRAIEAYRPLLDRLPHRASRKIPTPSGAPRHVVPCCS